MELAESFTHWWLMDAWGSGAEQPIGTLQSRLDEAKASGGQYAQPAPVVPEALSRDRCPR